MKKITETVIKSDYENLEKITFPFNKRFFINC